MKPLAGIKVVELARILAGPWCGQLLADLGAEVVKVERPGAGDDTRHWGPPFLYDAEGASLDAAYFHSTNRGKRGVAIDIATPGGQAAARALIADADVVIENYKVGGLARYGLDHASLSAAHPRLVTCSITGFGQTGPYAHRAGYDFIIQGMGGAMSITGEPDGPPQKSGIAYADVFTGVYSAVAILAALRRRDETGAGAHIDMALLDTQVAVLANQALNWMASGQVPRRMGNGHANLVPYQAFACADGELIVAVGNDAQFGRLCEVLGLPLAADARFATNPARLTNRDRLIPTLARAMLDWPKAALAKALERAGVPAGPINRIDEVFADPQVIARGLRVTLDGLPGVAGPIVIDGERMVSDRPSPRRGGAGKVPPRQIAIAGCGVAGLAAALLLSRDGHRVTMFERFATPRPMGSGLMIQPTGLAVLRALGCESAVRAGGARIERLFGEAAGTGRTVLDVRYAALGREAMFGVGIHRAALFHILHDRVRSAGILLETNRTIINAVPAANGRCLAFEDGGEAGPFDLVVDATGTRSRLAPPAGSDLAYGALWATLDWPADAGLDDAALQQRYRAASVMAGVLPIGSIDDGTRRCAFFWSLRADRLAAWREAGMAAWKADVRALWPALEPLLAQLRDPAQLTFAGYAHRTLARPTVSGLIHIGDAWHSTSPQLGQGANMALLDAYALALAMREANATDGALDAAIALRRRHVRLYQAMSRLFTPVYQSDGRLLPWLRDWLVGPLSKRWPATRIQAAMVSGLVGDPLTPLGLA